MECSKQDCGLDAVCRLTLLLFSDAVSSPATTTSEFAMCREHGVELRDNLAPLLMAVDWDQLHVDFVNAGHAPPVRSLTKAKLEFFE